MESYSMWCFVTVLAIFCLDCLNSRCCEGFEYLYKSLSEVLKIYSPCLCLSCSFSLWCLWRMKVTTLMTILVSFSFIVCFLCSKNLSLFQAPENGSMFVWFFSRTFLDFTFMFRSSCYSWSVYSSNYSLGIDSSVWVSVPSVLFFPHMLGDFWLSPWEFWGLLLMWILIQAGLVGKRQHVLLGALLAFILGVGWGLWWLLSPSSTSIHTHMFLGAKNKVAGHKQGMEGVPAVAGGSQLFSLWRARCLSCFSLPLTLNL